MGFWSDLKAATGESDAAREAAAEAASRKACANGPSAKWLAEHDVGQAKSAKSDTKVIKASGVRWDGRQLSLRGSSVKRMRRRGALECGSMYGEYVGMRLRGQSVTIPLVQIASVGRIGRKIQVFTTGGEEYRFDAPRKLIKAIAEAQSNMVLAA